MNRTIVKALILAGPALAMVSPVAIAAQEIPNELQELRAKVEEMSAREAQYEERLRELEERLLRIEAEPISELEASGIRGRYVPNAARPMTLQPELDGFRLQPRSAPEKAQLAVNVQQNGTPGAGQEEGPVQREPDQTAAVEDIVQQQQGVQRSRFGADLALGYTHFGDARINLDGFLALDAIFLGTISIDEVDSDIFTSDLTLRYSATEDLFFDASIPVLYRTSTFRSGGAGGAANEPVEASVDESGLGDVSLGVNYQLLAETARRPNLVLSGRVKFPTGQEPFGIDFIEVEGSEGNLQVPETLATGSGVYGASIGLSALKTLDPMVVFGSISYFRNFVRDFGDIDENPGDQPGRVDVGDAFQFGAGLAFALNDKSSISMSYSQRIVGRSRVQLVDQDWQRIVGSQANVALVNLGATFALSDQLSLVTTVGIGLTDDSPDMAVGIRLPYRF